ARENRRQTHSGVFLRSLLPSPWGFGKRSRQLEREVRQPSYVRFSGGVGRSHHRRIGWHGREPYGAGTNQLTCQMGLRANWKSANIAVFQFFVECKQQDNLQVVAAGKT